MTRSNNSKPIAPNSYFPVWALLIALLLFQTPVIAQTDAVAEKTLPSVQMLNPATQLWRDVRQRDMPAEGKTQVRGVDSGVLINVSGERWRQFRVSQLIPISGYVLAGVLVLLTLFYFIRGKVRIVGGPSDKKLPRYTGYERTIHWSMATLFIILGLTGLIILFGRPLLIPLIGKEAFSGLASLSKNAHNLLGPLFLLALVLVFIQFVRRNIYQKGDLTWLLRGGGVVGKKHVPSNFFNMGEKTMFWMLVFVGGTLAVSGLVMLLPAFGVGRELLELAHVGHSIGAILMIAVILGHIYIGSIGMEGAIEGMKTGYCDLNWAKEHHDLWASKAESEGQAIRND